MSGSSDSEREHDCRRELLLHLIAYILNQRARNRRVWTVWTSDGWNVL